MYTQNTEEALNALLQKYKVKKLEDINFAPGYTFINKETSKSDAPLQSWRYNRKFTELRNLIVNEFVEHPSMFRFCAIGDNKWNLAALIYREFDLCEFIGSCNIVSVHATLNQASGSVVARLANGVICSIEIGASLPEGTSMIDRHEIIARRGVASDIVVDTQVPQSSIYTFSESGNKKFKDIDNELYGLEETDVEFIRSIFESCKCPELVKSSKERHIHLVALIDEAFKSDKLCKKIIL